MKLPTVLGAWSSKSSIMIAPREVSSSTVGRSPFCWSLTIAESSLLNSVRPNITRREPSAMRVSWSVVRPSAGAELYAACAGSKRLVPR